MKITLIIIIVVICLIVILIRNSQIQGEIHEGELEATKKTIDKNKKGQSKTPLKKQSPDWKNSCVGLLTKYAQFVTDFPKLVNELILKEKPEMTEPLKEIMSWETTPKIISFISAEVEKASSEFVTEAELNTWMEHVKKEMGVKGKPLFQGVRAALTGHDHCPDLKFLIPLTPVTVLKKRVEHLKG